MQTLNQALFILLQKRQISLEEAMNRSLELDEFKMMLEAARNPGAQLRSR